MVMRFVCMLVLAFAYMMLAVPHCFWLVDIERLFCGVTVVGALWCRSWIYVAHICLCVANELVSRCFVIGG